MILTFMLKLSLNTKNKEYAHLLESILFEVSNTPCFDHIRSIHKYTLQKWFTQMFYTFLLEANHYLKARTELLSELKSMLC